MQYNAQLLSGVLLESTPSAGHDAALRTRLGQTDRENSANSNKRGTLYLGWIKPTRLGTLFYVTTVGSHFPSALFTYNTSEVQ
jgi:hypothetical protein